MKVTDDWDSSTTELKAEKYDKLLIKYNKLKIGYIRLLNQNRELAKKVR